MAFRFAALTLGTLLFGAAPVSAKEPAKAPAKESKKAANDTMDMPPADETVTLKKGAKHTLTVPGLSRVALGDPSIADVTTTGQDGVELSGLAKGKTTLMIWDGAGKRRTYRIVVGG